MINLNYYPTAANLKVINTIASLGTDVTVVNDLTSASNGYLSISGEPSFKAVDIEQVTITPSVAEVLQVSVVTVATATTGATYTLSLEVNDITSGQLRIFPINVVANDAVAKNIAAQFVTAINSLTNVSVTATIGSYDGNFKVTAKTGFPTFGINNDGDSKLAIGTDHTDTAVVGVVGVGSGTALAAQWNANSGFYQAGVYAQSANIVSTNYYTQVKIQSWTGNCIWVLVNEGTSAGSPSTTNYADLLGSYGTITGLKAGYTVTISAPATTTAAVTVTTGAIALASGSTTFATLGAQSGDYIVIGSNITKITGITGASAGFGTLTTAVSAATFKYASWRNFGL